MAAVAAAPAAADALVAAAAAGDHAGQQQQQQQQEQPGGQLTADQAAVYDRQLRVWGVEVQQRLTAARVLVCGFGQLAAEVAKNVTLAGVGRVTLRDASPAARFAGRNFLVPSAGDGVGGGQTAAEAAVRTLQAMNPLVRVSAAPGPAALLLPRRTPQPGGTDNAANDADANGADAAAADGADANDAALIRAHDLVVAVGLPLLAVERLDAACRAAGVRFMAAQAAGPGGWLFLDLPPPRGASGSGSGGSGAGGAAAAGAAGAAGTAPLSQPQQQQPQPGAYPSFADAMAAEPGPTAHAMFRALQACHALEKKLQRPLRASDLADARQLLRPGAAAAAAADAEQLLAALVASRGDGGGGDDDGSSSAGGAAPAGGLGDEFAPVAAVVGGVAANNAVAAVSGSAPPLRNLLYFSLADSRAIVELQPPAAAATTTCAAGGAGAGAGTGAGAGAGAGGQQQQQEAAVEID